MLSEKDLHVHEIARIQNSSRNVFMFKDSQNEIGVFQEPLLKHYWLNEDFIHFGFFSVRETGVIEKLLASIVTLILLINM